MICTISFLPSTRSNHHARFPGALIYLLCSHNMSPTVLHKCRVADLQDVLSSSDATVISFVSHTQCVRYTQCNKHAPGALVLMETFADRSFQERALLFQLDNLRSHSLDPKSNESNPHLSQDGPTELSVFGLRTRSQSVTCSPNLQRVVHDHQRD